MKIKYLLVLFPAVLLLAACNFRGVRGSGDLDRETRNVENFKEIEVGGAFEVFVKVGESTSLEIEGDDNLLQYIRTRVKGDRLEIDTRKNIRPKKDLIIRITTPELEKIISSGASTVSVSNINSEVFKIILSGASSINLDGSTDKFRVEMSGAGSLDAYNLKAKDVDISISGACSADVYASEYLDAEVSGVGSIEYAGNPSKVNTNVSGVGSISRKDD